MTFDEYREKMKNIRNLINRCKEVYGRNTWMCGTYYFRLEDRKNLLQEFYKELTAYKKTLPEELIKKVDLGPFKKYDCSSTFGNEDDGWYVWGPQDEIITTFAFYYHERNDFEESFEKTLNIYKSTKRKEWFEGKEYFLEKLLLS